MVSSLVVFILANISYQRSVFTSSVILKIGILTCFNSHNYSFCIRALSDMDSDGRLGCEEFVLAMHLCDQASVGNTPPAVLPPDLIPPSFRRIARTVSRTASISSQGSGQPDVDITLISQSKFVFFPHLHSFSFPSLCVTNMCALCSCLHRCTNWLRH